MKRRILLLLGASAMSITSLVGVTAAATTPAAAQATPAQVNAAQFNPIVSIGYIIQCITPQHLVNDFALCLINAVHQLLASLPLPRFLPFSTSTPAGLFPTGWNAKALNLPSNASSILKTLPSALQTTPVASAPNISAPIRQFIPHTSFNTAALPKHSTFAPIKFLNVADTKPAGTSNPISASDVLAIAAIGILGASAVTVRSRRRSAAVS